VVRRGRCRGETGIFFFFFLLVAKEESDAFLFGVLLDGWMIACLICGINSVMSERCQLKNKKQKKEATEQTQAKRKGDFVAASLFWICVRLLLLFRFFFVAQV